MTNTNNARTRASLALLTAGLLAAGLAPASPAAAASAATESSPASAASHRSTQSTNSAKAIPFTKAQVVDTADGGHQVIWKAPKVHSVKVYVSSNASERGRVVATRGGAGSLTLPAAKDGVRQYVRLVPDHGAALVVADRELGLASAPNLRDAGGYRTTSGQWVRMGLVYRSSALSLGDADLAVVSGLGLGTASDLRTSAESTKTPDVLPAGVRYQHLNVIGDSTSMVPDLSSEAAAQQMMTEGERQFVLSSTAQQAYHSLFTDLAWSDGASLYHCTAGKDRTGWASAVLLSLLGVPRDQVMADYLLSNDYYLDSPGIQGMLSALPPSQASIYRHLMGVEAGYLQAGFDQVEETYGSMTAYARRGLGLSTATIRQLRAKMLVGAPRR